MILVFGSINVDLVARVDAIPRPGETVLSPGAATFFGGKGANQAVAAARSGAQRVIMAGAIGEDAFGAACRENFARRGVALDALQQVAAPTGLAFIAVDRAGENAITVASGANLALSAQALPEAVFEGLSLCVLQMEVPLAQSLITASRARAAGARVLTNLAPAPQTMTPQDLATLLRLSDILVVNQHEAETVIRIAPQGIDSLERLAGVFELDLVMTRGAEGLTHIDLQGMRRDHPAEPVDVRDTTGAGDTFVGALAAALSLGEPMATALRLATRAASRACTWEGAQPPLDLT